MRRRARELRWSSSPPRPIPRHPYRDTAIVYGFFAGLVVLLGWATGGSVLKALGLAVAFFVAAVAWSWFRWRQRLAQQAASTESEEQL